MSETESFPEFWVSEPPADSAGLRPVYYKVTGSDPGGRVFWSREGSGVEHEGTFYDLFLEAANGFGVRRCGIHEDTPWDTPLERVSG
jgi:hypothetical protein